MPNENELKTALEKLRDLQHQIVALKGHTGSESALHTAIDNAAARAEEVVNILDTVQPKETTGTTVKTETLPAPKVEQLPGNVVGVLPDYPKK